MEYATAYCRLLCNIKLTVLQAFSIVFIRDIFRKIFLLFKQTKNYCIIFKEESTLKAETRNKIHSATLHRSLEAIVFLCLNN